MPNRPPTPAELTQGGRKPRHLKEGDLVKLIAQTIGITNLQAKRAIKTIEAAIRGRLKQGLEIHITDFGYFHRTQMQSRVGRNPRTGASIRIRAHRKASFTAYPSLLDRL